MPDIVSPESGPINWHDWKDVLVRVVIPLSIVGIVGYYMIDFIINSDAVNNCIKECSNWSVFK